jgi:hypothetical protein
MARQLGLWIVALSVGFGLPAMARADTYMLHLGGMCSTDYLGGKGSATLFQDWAGVTAVNLRVDQRTDHDAAVSEMVGHLDNFCRGTDDCYVIAYSNGGAVIAQALSVFGGTPGHDWNINWVIHQGSNTGGSNLSDIAGSWWASWLSDLIFCDMADEITPDVHRATFDHHDTDGVTFFMLAGFDTWWYSDVFLPDEDDGAVGMDSAAGYVFEGRYGSACGTPRWTNHVPAWYCGFDRDHYSMKNAARDCLRLGHSSTCYGG